MLSRRQAVVFILVLVALVLLLGPGLGYLFEHVLDAR